ncbi:MAG TPA: cupredoxin domain-containing protein [Nitrososphaeraceae archaeon]|nr:cupredoxin domain-containing protein [Nitrososphaeraceae archaeon]
MINNIIAILVISFIIVGSLWGIGNLLNPQQEKKINSIGLLLLAENNFFNKTNPTLYINSNIPQKITIVNKDFVRHDFIVDELNINTGYLYSNQDFTTAIASRESGIFEYYCSLHPSIMRGKIVISEIR